MMMRIKMEEVGEFVEEVVIPTERISEIKRGKKVETERKLYPGYLFVKMALYYCEFKNIKIFIFK
jgi:transcriptional antiterminator NusG